MLTTGCDSINLPCVLQTLRKNALINIHEYANEVIAYVISDERVMSKL